MASRKEQKERLRREREERERAAKAAARRKRIVGIAIGGAIASAAIVAIIVVIAGSGGGDGPGGAAPSAGDLPGGGSVPEQREDDLRRAAQAAGCVTKDYAGMSREHLAPGEQPPAYQTEPPTSGKHAAEPAEDGAYGEAPARENLVHTLEHGRVIIWFKSSLPEDQIADLKALFDEDQYQMVLVPNDRMKVQVAATAWNADPEPNGTGRLLECPRFDDRIFDALRAFRDEHRGRGPEPVP